MASQNFLQISAVVVALLIAFSTILADAQLRVHGKVIPPPPPAKKWNPWQGEEIPPEPRKGYYQYLKDCGEILTDDCGLEVFDYTFYKINRLTPGCCVNLVKMGELCNRSLAITLSTLKKYQRWSGHIFERSMEAYYKCNATVHLPPN